ncbi:MAG: TonB-dependent receptor [Nevskiales bacterium]
MRPTSAMRGVRRWPGAFALLACAMSHTLHAQDTVAGSEQAAVPDPVQSGGAAEQTAPLPTIPVELSASGPKEDAVVREPESVLIEEIVVTAQKRVQTLQDIPIAASVIRADDIQQAQIVSLSDLSNRLSGFHFGEIAGGGQASIRGVGFSLVTGAGEGSVAVHSDGLFLSRPGSITMLQEDIARIEVLRGPQGTLYGRNATAGVVNLSTPEPPEQFEAGGGALTGDIGRRKYSLHLGDSFADGALRLRVSGVTDRIGDYFINERFPGVDYGSSHQDGFRLAGDWLAADALKLELRAFLAEQDFAGPLYSAYKPPANAVLAPPGTYSNQPYGTRVNTRGVSSKDLTGGSLKAIWNLADELTLSSQTGYVKFEFDSPEGYDGDGTSNDIFRTFRFNPSRTFTEELNLNFESRDWQWLLGAFFLKEKITLNFDVDLAVSGVANTVLSNLLPGLDPNLLEQLLAVAGQNQKLDIQNYSAEKTTSWAVFGDTTYSILKDLRVFGGLRYLKDRKSQVLTSRIFPRATPQVGVTNCQDLTTPFDDSAATSRIGLQYDLAAEVKSYAQYSTGYKSGGFSVAACGDTFKPEQVKAYEVGLKSSWLQRRVRFNAAAFLYGYKNLQVEEVVLPSVIINNAQARVRGGEFEVSALPFQTLELGVNATFLDARYTDFVNADNTDGVLGGPDQQLAGNYLNRSPKVALALSGQYTVRLDRWGSLIGRVEGNYNSRAYLREFNNSTDYQDAHWILNGYLNYLGPANSLQLRGFVKNATNEPVLGGFLGIAGYKAASFNPPRTIGIELAYSFP